MTSSLLIALPLVEFDERGCGDGELRVETESLEEVLAGAAEKLLAHPALKKQGGRRKRRKQQSVRREEEAAKR